MAELDDLIKSAPFKCQQCEAELTSVSLLASIMFFGVVLLIGEEDGLVGTVVPCILPDADGKYPVSIPGVTKVL